MNATQILSDLALLVVPLVIPAVGTYGVKLLRAHVRAKTLTQLTGVASVAVPAAEQVGAAEGWPSTQKKGQAVIMAAGLLDRLGLSVSPPQLSSLIEASVSELKAVGGQLSTPTGTVTVRVAPPVATTTTTVAEPSSTTTTGE